MTARSRHLFAAAAWWATLAAALVWWVPSIALMLGRLAASRLRFRLALGLGRALVAVGLRDAARRVYGAEAERAGRRLQAVRERWSGRRL